MYDESPDNILLKTDFENAFNTVPRSLIYRGLVSQGCHKLLNWFRWAYGEPTPIVDSKGRFICNSGKGCRQGDPLAALLFCVAIHAALEEMHQRINALRLNAVQFGAFMVECPPSRLMAYMDDCTICVHKEIAAEACAIIVEVCERYHLPLNLDKCRAFGQLVAEVEGLSFASVGTGQIVLGVPVGDREYRAGEYTTMFDKVKSTLMLFDSFKLQTATTFNLIKFCVNTRVAYAVRAGDVDTLEKVESIDVAVDKALCKMVRHDPSERLEGPLAVEEDFTEDVRSNVFSLLRSLPLNLGGLGVHRHSWISGQTAIVKSRRMTRDFLLDSGEELQINPDILPQPIDIGRFHGPIPVEYAPAERNGVEHPEFDLDADISPDEMANDQYLAAFNTLATLLYPQHPKLAAMFVSNGFAGSGRWLSPVFNLAMPRHLVLTDAEYYHAIRTRLLLGICSERWGDVCFTAACSCGRVPTFRDAFHYLDCTRTAHAYYNFRHNRVQTVVKDFLKRHFNVQIEDQPMTHRARMDHRYADLKISYIPRVGGTVAPFTKLLDFVVSNPSAESYLPREGELLVAGNGNRYQEREKNQEYEDVDEDVTPFAVEITGRVGEEARMFIELMEQEPELLKGGRRGHARVSRVATLQGQLSRALAKVCGRHASHAFEKARDRTMSELWVRNQNINDLQVLA
jgi:hypothetical protein